MTNTTKLEVYRIKSNLLTRIIVVYIIPVIFSFVLIWIFGGLKYLEWKPIYSLIVVVFLLLEYFLHEQYNIVELIIYKHKLTVKYPISLILKDKNILVSNIEEIKFSRFANKLLVTTTNGDTVKIKNPGSTTKTELSSKLKNIGLTVVE